MSFNINNHSSTILTILFIALIAKLAGVGVLYLLPKNGVEFIEDASFNMPYRSYRASNLFALEMVKVEEKKVEAVAPVYNLNTLKLKAVYKASNGGFIVASDSTQANKSVFIKYQTEYNGYLLEEIKEDEAVFSRNNQKYKITMDKRKSATSYTPPPPKEPAESSDIVRAVSKTEVHKYTTDFKAIWKSISIKEIVNNGKIEGFKVTRISKGTIFDKLGLKENDVITAVNNKTLKTYADAFKIYKDVNKMTSLKITVLRNNQPKDLEYEIY